jgi:hypothetical protein
VSLVECKLEARRGGVEDSLLQLWGDISHEILLSLCAPACSGLCRRLSPVLKNERERDICKVDWEGGDIASWSVVERGVVMLNGRGPRPACC